MINFQFAKTNSKAKSKLTNSKIGNWKLINCSFPKGFTLVELIIAIGLFGLMSVLVLQNLFAVYRYKDVVRYRKEINMEASLALNNGIAGLIRSGYGINYDQTKNPFDRRTLAADQYDTVMPAVDQLAIYMDPPGLADAAGNRRYFVIRREGHDTVKDIARLYIEFWAKGNKIEEFPLHSSETVVEQFDITVQKKATTDEALDLQPYVTLYLKVRHRYPDGDSTRSREKYQEVRASYQTTYMLRNTD